MDPISEGLQRARELTSEFPQVLSSLLGLALTATSSRSPEHAARLHGAIDALLAEHHHQFDIHEARLRDKDRATLSARLGAAKFSAALEAGRTHPGRSSSMTASSASATAWSAVAGRSWHEFNDTWRFWHLCPLRRGSTIRVRMRCMPAP